ncbi:MAG TPA: ricin-type beta-trefoil lectin domain protein [Pseudonocardiaceae bacterium]|jgi:chitinase|nr:ricin-type beta-trefoil lectin domain protein [Pseudonocardiaceae bacterium]
MRISRTKVLLAAAIPAAIGTVLIGQATFASAAAAPAAGAAFPAHYAAPYLQIGDDDAGDLASDMNATGTKFYTLAFLTPKSGCTPEWEDGGDAVGAFKSQISSLQSAGGNVAISFGGAQGGEIAQTCTTTSSLTAAYANVVNTYGVDRLDFDIEGDVMSDTASNARRDSALAALQAQNPAVQIDFTISVNGDGLPGNELDMLRDAQSKGVKVSVVNIMTMDFGDGQNALNDSLSAAKGTAGQLASLYGISTSAAYAKMGLTPIAGKNDDNENFTQANAQTLESFAATNGVAELSFWEVDEYDKNVGYAYSRIFNAITGSSTGGGTGGGGATGQITGIASKCVDVQSASSADGTPVQLYTCNGTAAQQWTVGTDGTLQSLGKCMDVTGGGTANGTLVQLWTCAGNANQQWTASNGELVNPQSGKCLDATGQSSADSTRLQLWSCTGSANQLWKLP